MEYAAQSGRKKRLRCVEDTASEATSRRYNKRTSRKIVTDTVDGCEHVHKRFLTKNSMNKL